VEMSDEVKESIFRKFFAEIKIIHNNVCIGYTSHYVSQEEKKIIANSSWNLQCREKRSDGKLEK